MRSITTNNRFQRFDNNNDNITSSLSPTRLAIFCMVGFVLGTALAVGAWAGASINSAGLNKAPSPGLSISNCIGNPCLNITSCRSGVDDTCGEGPDYCNTRSSWTSDGCCDRQDTVSDHQRRQRVLTAENQRQRVLSTCSGTACTCAGCCRSEWGYCGDTDPWCNDKSTWTPACAPSSPSSSPTTKTSSPTLKTGETSIPTTPAPSLPPTFAPTKVQIICPTRSPTTLTPTTATNVPTAPTAPTAPTTKSPTPTIVHSPTSSSSSPTVTSTTPQYTTKHVGTYFTEWGIYGRNYKVQNLDVSGQANLLTFVNYAFANIYKVGSEYRCDAGVTHTETGNGDGGDQWALYGRGFASGESVDGIADVWDQKLKGNMNQLKKLKVKYPSLKIILSIGGWTWSKWFSAASATDALRKTLVSSCIDQFIKGNLPVDAGTSTGGAGVGKGVFDGIDIDWEFEGVQGIGTNTVDEIHDPTNMVLLFQEFRSQLDAAGLQAGTRYYLSTAISAGADKIQHTIPASYSASLDWVNLMSYDYHGAWDSTGPTDFHSNLYIDPASPNYASQADFCTNAAVNHLISAGMPKEKINIGIPFYGRGWKGVSAGSSSTYPGLYQTANGAASGTYEAGFEDYKVLKSKTGTVYRHSVTHQSYKYSSSTTEFWSFDTIGDVQEKADWVKVSGLGGVFSWSADGDLNNELTTAMATVRS
jgi:chitinase